MTYRKLGALVAVGAIALAFATNETIARTGGAAVAGAPRITTVRPTPHVLHGFRHHGRFNGGFFWPGYGDTYGTASPTGEPITAPLAGPNNVHYTYTYDVPWD